MFSVFPAETPASHVTHGLFQRVMVPRTYQVDYQLKRGTMYLGQVINSFFVPCARRFPTNELNVILAELYEEIGPAYDLLGIEILAICQYHSAGTKVLHRVKPRHEGW